ncbi:MAG: HAD-IC family P-type ATPase [Desulfitobacteriaceae bacterium]
MWNKYIHLVPGRLRIKVPGLKGNDYMAEGLHTMLMAVPSIERIGTNLLTGSLLIYFDQEVIDGFSIIIYVDEGRNHFNRAMKPLRERPNSMLTRRALKVFLIASAVVTLFTKQRIVGPSLLSGSGTLENVATATGLFIAYPVFLWGLKHPKLTRRLSYDLVMNSISFSLLILQESITGLLLALTVNVSKLIMALDLSKTRQITGRIGKLPEMVWVNLNGTELAVPLGQVTNGDVVIVRCGETIPIDGQVIEGTAEVDESQISGLSEPVRKESGSKVLAGSEIIEGSLQVLVESTGPHTQLFKLIRTSVHRRGVDQEEAIFKERINRMVYFSMLAAGGVYLITGSTSRALAILLAGSPAAAGLAVSTANGVAIGEGVQRGIYIKKGKHLWEASQVNAIVLDKMAALAPSEIVIQEIIAVNRNFNPEEILRLAAVAEGMVGTALAQAIREKAYQMHLGPLPTAVEMDYIPGLGVKAKLKGQTILLGHKSLMLQENVKIQRVESKAMRFRHLGLNPVYVSFDNKLCGLLGLRETINPGIRQAIEELRALGIHKIALVTRDDLETAEIMANQLGITEFYANLEPVQKAGVIHTLNEQGYKVAMVGDGIDDALAMAKAKVSVAWGKKGADSAARVAGIVISAQDPQLLVETISLAQKTREVIKQNMNLAIGLNLMGIGLGTSGLINHVTAAFLGHVGTIAVIFNSNFRKWVK